MSGHTHTTGKTHESKHGSMLSYVVGFLLSLICTFIPYQLVVNQKLTGTALLVTILGFAVVQMIVQVTFFLHLGRGPKPNWNLFFFVATVGIILMVVGGSVFIMSNLYRNMSPSDQTKKLIGGEGIYQIGGEETGACHGQYTNHRVVIKNAKASPVFTEAYKCDTLTFINEDDEIREMTFGSHPAHGVYAGEKELIIKKDRSKTITLSETGTYRFHDHLDADIAGQFTVMTRGED